MEKNPLLLHRTYLGRNHLTILIPTVKKWLHVTPKQASFRTHLSGMAPTPYLIQLHIMPMKKVNHIIKWIRNDLMLNLIFFSSFSLLPVWL